ncbi:P-loop containing nucleoside triphosphate hydrolase protein [Hysterangium stoloniferum]|nr:P-loop containing nucleoside triphosphate hydrolase protein [Hysterangium stoloniferum]
MSALIQLLLSWSTGETPRDTCYGVQELAPGNSPVVESQESSATLRRQCRIPIFTGHQSNLEQLREYFVIPWRRIDERRHHLIYGRGGTGKTQICLKFAEECAKANRFWRIFWVDTTSAETRKIGFEAIANDPVAKDAGVEHTPESVLRWLSSVDEEWLLILDNADDQADELSKILPLATQGNILITSQNADLSQYVQKVTYLDAMEKTAAVQLLLKAANVQDSDPKHIIPTCIVEKLGFLPLAIDIAGAVIRNNVCSILEYPGMFAMRWQNKLDGGAAGVDLHIHAALDVSFAGIEKAGINATGPEAQMYNDAIFILHCLAFFHHQRILEDTFK